MDTNTIILAAVLLVALAAGVFLLTRAKQSKDLKSHFGPEYDRALDDAGDRRKAEALLHDREKRVKKYQIHPLQAGDRARFTTAWTQVQSEFVDDPKGAVMHADDLLADVMTARGYPVSTFEDQAADLSVEHPVVVQNYRAAHDIALRHKRGDAGTEDLRQAMIHYRALFDDLAISEDDLAPDNRRPTAQRTDQSAPHAHH
jgi:hypothetical protein